MKKEIAYGIGIVCLSATVSSCNMLPTRSTLVVTEKSVIQEKIVEANTSEEPQTVKQVEPAYEDDKKTITPLSNTSSEPQLVSAPKAGALAGSSATFPPGALSISTSITIEQSASLESLGVARDLGLSNSNNKILGEGAGVIIRPSIDTSAAKPFTLAIPVPGAGLQLNGDDQNLVVLYKIFSKTGH